VYFPQAAFDPPLTTKRDVDGEKKAEFSLTPQNYIIPRLKFVKSRSLKLRYQKWRNFAK